MILKVFMFKKIDASSLWTTPPKKGSKIIDSWSTDIRDCSFIFFGYPDDEGIKNNGGRPGAREAPNRIRKCLYSMTPHLRSPHKFPQFFDFGNQSENGTLADRHQEAIGFVESHLDQGRTSISLGGGHDYAYPDGRAFLNFCSDNPVKPVIINFDAHFDVRPLESKNKITSGTPFYRLLEDDNFEFIEVGIQDQCNSKEHFKYVQDKGGHVLFLDDLFENGDFKWVSFKNFFDPLNCHSNPCFLSIDIDVFSNAFAPGCSQSFASGLSPLHFFPMLEYIVEHFYVCSLGIYETSPPLDFDDRTSKLAAQIIYKFIYLKQSFKSKSQLLDSKTLST